MAEGPAPGFAQAQLTTMLSTYHFGRDCFPRTGRIVTIYLLVETIRLVSKNTKLAKLHKTKQNQNILGQKKDLQEFLFGSERC